MLGSALVLALPGCGGSNAKAGRRAPIVVNAPFSRTPYVGETIAQRRRARRGEVNGTAPVIVDGRSYRLRIRRLDNGLSARRSAENVRRAVADGAIAVVDDGTGVDASWRIAERADLPIGITYEGGIGLVDAEARPNVFRIAPTDRGISFRLAEYLIPKGLKLALLHDTSGYGREGATALDSAFGRNPEAVAAKSTLAAAGDVTPQVLRGEARRRDRAARLGSARRDRKGALRGAERRLGRAGLHAARGSRPARPPVSSPTTRTGSTG